MQLEMTGKLCFHPMGNTDMLFSFPSQNPEHTRQTNTFLQWLIQKCHMCFNRTLLLGYLGHVLFAALFKYKHGSQHCAGRRRKGQPGFCAHRSGINCCKSNRLQWCSIKHFILNAKYIKRGQLMRRRKTRTLVVQKEQMLPHSWTKCKRQFLKHNAMCMHIRQQPDGFLHSSNKTPMHLDEKLSLQPESMPVQPHRSVFRY